MGSYYGLFQIEIFYLRWKSIFYSNKTKELLDLTPEGIELKELSMGSTGLVEGQSKVNESDQAGVELRG